MRQLLNAQRLLYTFLNQDGAGVSQPPILQSDKGGTGENHSDRSPLGELKKTLIAIAVCAAVAVALIVVRLIAFHPRFSELLELQRTAEFLAIGLPH
jgi:hypothetical protein